MERDAPATKRDLNEMAEAIMGDVGRRFDEVNGRFDKLETLLRLVAVRMGITEPEIDEALQ